MKKYLMIAVILLIGINQSALAQVKVCMSYDDFVADQWKPYDQLTPDREPDTCRVKYDGMEFSIKTADKEVNNIIKKDVFIMSIDNQLFINSRTLRDDIGAVLPPAPCLIRTVSSA